MKIFLSIILLIFNLFSNAQNNVHSESKIRIKANLYFLALENLSTENLSELDKSYLSKNETKFQEYCATKAYHYYSLLIKKYPKSEDYVSYLYKKGLMAEELGSVSKETKNIEIAKNCYCKVISINASNYYTKLSLYYLATIYCNEGNCYNTKKCIEKLNKVSSVLINEYESGYIEIGIKRMTLLCSKKN